MALSEVSPVKLASLERTPEDDLRRQAIAVSCLSAVTAALAAVPVPIVAVNANRQIVYANEAMVGFVGADAAESLIGLRPGEALGCSHVLQGEGGCGTSPFCRYCGAARAMEESTIRALQAEEAHIVRPPDEPPEALDVRVSSRTFQVGGDVFTMLTITDISDQKRRQALERIFFHDVLNTVQKLRAAVDLVDEAGGDETGLAWGTIRKAVLRLTEEIQAQRDLATMERNELKLRPVEVRSRAFLEDLLQSYPDYSEAQRGRLLLDPDSDDVTFVIDPVKLRRVLDNMIRNALDAEAPDSTIIVGCRPLSVTNGKPHTHIAAVEFWVRNLTVMSESVQRQIFHRSFTTKGEGRGLGTYSMRMLTERYLEGKITFTSQPDEGTIFRARYPVDPELRF